MFFRIPLMLLVCFLSTSTAAASQRKTYIIHMDKEKITASDYCQGNAKTWLELVMDSITQFSSDENDGVTFLPELLYVYETSIFGFAAKLSIKQVQVLNKIPGFLSVSPDEILTLHTTHSPRFLGLQYGRGLWNASNLAADVIIGVLDSGIWPEHISFRDTNIPSIPSRWKGACEPGTNFSTSNCNKKLIGARAFFKGYEASGGKINGTLDFRSARDSQGHGTHTSSTAAGNVVDNANLFGMAEGSATGMRYTSRIAAYKVCWPLGCANSDILAAIDRAIADGVDVLSLSLGGIPRPYYTDSIAIASFGAIEKGVFVSCSAGNSGPSRSTVANVAPWIMTVAASYTDRSFPTMVRLGNGKVLKGSSLYHGKKTKQLPIVYGKTAGRQGAQFCINGSLNETMVKGKIVVCERGLNSRTEKGEQVKLAGGFGMITINRDVDGEELFADAHVLPATSLGASAGKAIKSYVLSTKKPTASLYFKGTVYGNQAPLVAGFSSRGPSAVGPDIIKPDITAPGVNILAAWPPVASPSLLKTDKRRVLFNIISGTSMSCPHVSGIAALIKSAHKDWSPAAIKSALMTTSYTLDNEGGPIKDVSSITSKFATPFAFGSGHVDPERAADPGLVYDISTQDYLNYLCSLKYTSSQIALLSKNNFTCPKLSVLQPGDLNYPSFAVLFNKTAQISPVTYKRTLTNVGYSTSTYVVQVQQLIGVSVTVRPKKLSFQNLGEKLNYKVTFSALPRKNNDTSSSFGSLAWVCGKYRVGSPIAVTWQ